MVKLNTGLKLAASFDLAQTETDKSVPISANELIWGGGAPLDMTRAESYIRSLEKGHLHFRRSGQPVF
jgi:hypothetical protein